MIQKIYLENFSTFKNYAELNLIADNYTKKFPNNVFDTNILKSAVIYGANNTGKTIFIESIKTIKNALLNKGIYVTSNLFSESQNTKLGIEFLINHDAYKFEFQTSFKNEIVYEKFSKIMSKKEEIIILKDTINKKYKCKNDKKLENILNVTSKNNILIYTLDVENFSILKQIKDILTTIGNKIEIIDMNHIPYDKTIEILKNKNDITPKIVNFIKNADLFLEDYYYDENSIFINNEFNQSIIEKMNQSKIKNNNLIDQLKITSVYKGVKVPSIIFDSLGTKKIAALASYIIEALENGKILCIDEMDSSLHFKLTRAIISMFNNDLNKNAQIICTLHDISLLDCKKLFRKEQIWFTDKNSDSSILYSLKNFSYADNGIRDTSDIIEKYSKGLLGAIPEPDLINVLLENNNEN